MKVKFESASVAEPEVVIKGDINSTEVQDLLDFIKSKNNNSTKKLLLYKEDEQFLVDKCEVAYIEVYGNKVRAITINGMLESKKKLYELKDALANGSFAQINKSTIVNIDFVKSVQAEFSGNYSLRLKNSREILTISRKYFKEFKSKI